MTRVFVPALAACLLLAGCGGDDGTPSAPDRSREIAAAERVIPQTVTDNVGADYKASGTTCVPGNGTNLTCRTQVQQGADPTTVRVTFPKVRCPDECYVDSTAATLDSGEPAFP